LNIIKIVTLFIFVFSFTSFIENTEIQMSVENMNVKPLSRKADAMKVIMSFKNINFSDSLITLYASTNTVTPLLFFGEIKELKYYANSPIGLTFAIEDNNGKIITPRTPVLMDYRNINDTSMNSQEKLMLDTVSLKFTKSKKRSISLSTNRKHICFNEKISFPVYLILTPYFNLASGAYWAKLIYVYIPDDKDLILNYAEGCGLLYKKMIISEKIKFIIK
jgi:hypothetical protein